MLLIPTHLSPGLRVKAALRGRVFTKDGGALRVRPVHGQSGKGTYLNHLLSRWVFELLEEMRGSVNLTFLFVLPPVTFVVSVLCK